MCGCKYYALNTGKIKIEVNNNKRTNFKRFKCGGTLKTDIFYVMFHDADLLC